jgi:hypothetical protein
LVWNHGDGDLVSILVHRAGRSIDPEPDNASEHNISGSHRFGIGGDHSRAGQIAFFAARNWQGLKPFSQSDIARRRHQLGTIFGLNGAGRAWRAGRVDRNELRCTLGDGGTRDEW